MAEKKSVKTVMTRWGIRPVGLTGFYPEQGPFEGCYYKNGDFAKAPFWRLREPKNAQQIINQFVAASAA